jgi:hypothetical protein
MRTLVMLALAVAVTSCAGSPPSTKAATGPAAIPVALIPPGYVAADCHVVQAGKDDVQGSKDLNFECTKKTVVADIARAAGTAPSEAESAPQPVEHDANGYPVGGCHVTHDDPNNPNASSVAHVRCTTRTEYGVRMNKTAKCRSPGGQELPPEEYCCSTPSGDPIPHCTPRPLPLGQ